MTKQIPSGTVAKTAIQCICPDTQKTGSFFFTGDSHRVSGSRVSPVMADLVELWQWADANGWTERSSSVYGARVYRPASVTA